MKVVTTQPSIADRMVIRKSADKAARKTVSLLFLIARMAAMKKVLSPISDTKITVIDSPESYLLSVQFKNIFLNQTTKIVPKRDEG